MFRIKIPWGGLSAVQLELLAELAAKTQKGVGHVTTRQNIQLHFIKLEQVAGLMKSLASVGLTTREPAAIPFAMSRSDTVPGFVPRNCSMSPRMPRRLRDFSCAIR